MRIGINHGDTVAPRFIVNHGGHGGHGGLFMTQGVCKGAPRGVAPERPQIIIKTVSKSAKIEVGVCEGRSRAERPCIPL
jgi:hypothetical protein